MSAFGRPVTDWIHGGSARLEFEFTVELELAEDDPLLEAVAQRLESAGVQDALVVGAGATCAVELQFIARARTAQEALSGAATAVEQAFGGARITRVVAAPDTPSTLPGDRITPGGYLLSGPDLGACGSA